MIDSVGGACDDVLEYISTSEDDPADDANGSESVVRYLCLLRPFVQLDAWNLATVRISDSPDDPSDNLVIRPKRSIDKSLGLRLGADSP